MASSLSASLSAVRAVKTIVTHDSCPDGTASALILKDALPDAEVRFLQHGSFEHKGLQPEEGMLFCDIAPPADRVRDFVAAGSIVLDHHRTARGVVEQFESNGVFADESAEPGVCGAVLAYRHVWMPVIGAQSLGSTASLVQQFAVLAGIRDTWVRHDPRWEEACAQASVLKFIPNAEWLTRGLVTVVGTWDRDFQWLGQIIQNRLAADVARMAGKGWTFTTDRGTRVLLIPSTGLTSDVAEKLGVEYDLILGFAYTYDPKLGAPQLVLSTRSHAQFDCAAFCKRFGGGGHTRAAGCSFMVGSADPNPYAFIEALVRASEAG